MEEEKNVLEDALRKIADERLNKVLPTRSKGEPKKKFMGRCMGNPTMLEEFPDRAQRYQVCLRQANKK